MSLNSIELPDYAIAGLFKNTLIAGPESAPVAAPEKKSCKFLGGNAKKITLLVNATDAVFLPEKHLAFISKILEACKINIGDVAIVNHAVTPVIISELKQQTAPAVLLLFGIEPADIKLPISFPQFKMQAYDGCTYLFTPSLNELDQQTEEGKILKSKLWVCLKTLFTV